MEGPRNGVVWQPVSRRLVWLRRLQVALAAGPAGAVALVVPLLLGAPLLAAGLAAAVLAAALVAEWLLRRRAGAWAYAERDDDLLVRRGLLVRRLSVVPYGRMQFVDVTSGPLSRWCGLAELRLHTAAAASDARVPGLPMADADRLRDRLTALGEARAAGL